MGDAKTSRRARQAIKIPESLKDIRGTENITTVQQLLKLTEYCSLPLDQRPPVIRLGCSVPHGEARTHLATSSTWAVTVDGVVEVIHITGKDPRSSWKFMTNPARPWNIDGAVAAAAATAAESEPKVRPLHYIVSVAELDTGPFPVTSMCIEVLCSRRGRGADGAGTEEYLVCALPGWWLKPPFQQLLLAVRLAAGEIFSGDSGCYWAFGDKRVRFAPMSFADLTLTAHNGEQIGDPVAFLRQVAKEQILKKVCGPFYNLTGDDKRYRGIAFRAALQVRKLDLQQITQADLNAIAAQLRATAVPAGACA